MGVLLKHPDWIDFLMNDDQLWSQYNLNSVPRYSLLVCHSFIQTYCSSERYRSLFLSSALHFPHLVRVFGLFFILEISPISQTWYLLCPYCNQCLPFMLLRIDEHIILNSNHLLKTFEETVVTKNARSNPITIRLRAFLPQFDDIERLELSKRQIVLQHINQTPLSDAEDMAYLSDIHLLSNFLFQNYTLNFIAFGDKDKGRWKISQLNSCSSSQNVLYHPKLRSNQHLSHLLPICQYCSTRVLQIYR